MSLVNLDEYFREKLNRLSVRDYSDLMRRYVFKAVREGGVPMNEFDKDIDELLKKDDKNMPLAKNERLVYKKNVSTNEFVKVGVVDNCGYVDFYDSDKTVDKFNIGLYYPEFFMDIVDTKQIRQVSYKDGEIVGSKYLNNYITGTYKKEFVPRNIFQQVVTQIDSILLKPEEYYVTGYVTREGRVYYYDQYL